MSCSSDRRSSSAIDNGSVDRAFEALESRTILASSSQTHVSHGKSTTKPPRNVFFIETGTKSVLGLHTPIQSFPEVKIEWKIKWGGVHALHVMSVRQFGGIHCRDNDPFQWPREY
jgi:hypothetical protein